MHLPAASCKIQRKKRETDGFSKNILMTPPGSHPTSGFGARHGLPKFFRHKRNRAFPTGNALLYISPLSAAFGRVRPGGRTLFFCIKRFVSLA